MFLFNVPLFGTACYVKSKLQFEISSHTSIIFLLQVKKATSGVTAPQWFDKLRLVTLPILSSITLVTVRPNL